MLLDKQINGLAEDLVAFMQKKFGFDRLPVITYVDDANNSVNPLCMTGGYDQESESITIYITGRHPKDILRSLAHEMLHHVQKCDGMMDDRDMSATTNPNYIMHDKFLKQVEADAFERGNICFREWEATKKGDKTMSESKKMTDTQVKKAHKLGKKLKGKEGIDEPYALATYMAKKGVNVDEVSYEKSGLKKPKLADRNKDGDVSDWEKAVADKIEDKVDEQKEVQVNEALKNAHNYNTVTRALPTVAAARDEFVFQELIKKFGIKK